jgi:hypothetical protein
MDMEIRMDLETWRYEWTWRHGDTDIKIWTWRHGKIKQKTEAQAIFPNPFTVCSSCKRKFAVCPFVAEVTNGSYPFAKGLWKNHKYDAKETTKSQATDC